MAPEEGLGHRRPQFTSTYVKQTRMKSSSSFTAEPIPVELILSRTLSLSHSLGAVWKVRSQPSNDRIGALPDRDKTGGELEAAKKTRVLTPQADERTLEAGLKLEAPAVDDVTPDRISTAAVVASTMPAVSKAGSNEPSG